MLSLGHLSPSVITPRGLKKLLTEIKGHLPYDPRGKIWKFYQTLSCATAIDQGKFLIIVSIPLLNKNNKYEAYSIFNMPVPLKDSLVPKDQSPNMVAWYRLEASSIAINIAKMKYVLLTHR